MDCSAHGFLEAADVNQGLAGAAHCHLDRQISAISCWFHLCSPFLSASHGISVLVTCETRSWVLADLSLTEVWQPAPAWLTRRNPSGIWQRGFALPSGLRLRDAGAKASAIEIWLFNAIYHWKLRDWICVDDCGCKQKSAMRPLQCSTHLTSWCCQPISNHIFPGGLDKTPTDMG